MAPTEVYWPKDTKGYWKGIPHEEISELIIQIQYQYLGSEEQGSFPSSVWPVIPLVGTLWAQLGAQRCSNLGWE